MINSRISASPIRDSDDHKNMGNQCAIPYCTRVSSHHFVCDHCIGTDIIGVIFLDVKEKDACAFCVSSALGLIITYASTGQIGDLVFISEQSFLPEDASCPQEDPEKFVHAFKFKFKSTQVPKALQLSRVKAQLHGEASKGYILEQKKTRVWKLLTCLVTVIQSIIPPEGTETSFYREASEKILHLEAGRCIEIKVQAPIKIATPMSSDNKMHDITLNCGSGFLCWVLTRHVLHDISVGTSDITVHTQVLSLSHDTLRWCHDMDSSESYFSARCLPKWQLLLQRPPLLYCVNEDNEENEVNVSKTYRNFFRMCSSDFQFLVAKVTAAIAKQDTNMKEAIPPPVRLAITLRFIATVYNHLLVFGMSYSSLSHLFRVSMSQVAKIIPECCDAVYNKIAQEFEDTWNFPNCIGALDGKHVVIQAPASSGSVYFNYKGTHSEVLLAVVDAKVADDGVYNQSALPALLEGEAYNIPGSEPLKGRMKPVPFAVLADDAFVMTPRILKPFRFRNQLGDIRVYNYRHPSYSVLRTLICTLHNFLLTRKTNYVTATTFDTHVRVSQKEGSPGNNLHTLQTLKPQNVPHFCKEVRNELKHYFMSPDGEIEWQDNGVLSSESEDEMDLGTVAKGKHDLLVKTEAKAQTGFFKSNKKQHPMFPFFEEKIKFDEYGEIISITLSLEIDMWRSPDKCNHDYVSSVHISVLHQAGSAPSMISISSRVLTGYIRCVRTNTDSPVLYCSPQFESRANPPSKMSEPAAKTTRVFKVRLGIAPPSTPASSKCCSRQPLASPPVTFRLAAQARHEPAVATYESTWGCIPTIKALCYDNPPGPCSCCPPDGETSPPSSLPLFIFSHEEAAIDASPSGPARHHSPLVQGKLSASPTKTFAEDTNHHSAFGTPGSTSTTRLHQHHQQWVPTTMTGAAAQPE
ncbi:hypothetical protein PR048_001351 [Dryococelus australis]|uniref:DDE Tnp4 domain-containing protein n=1 Tax=Dryococelus australis TaxID=614101 RepID=A0ABQ9IH41_9NEOP|nr:hypothetical protein PR048_001351 [Dryococelus australis]